MPTFARTQRFVSDWDKLTREQRQALATVLPLFVEDARTGNFRASLRVKQVQSVPGVWEMTWAPDGRATFEYGLEVKPGERHVIWRRVGTHADPATSLSRYPRPPPTGAVPAGPVDNAP